jgi:hypothetical protein
MLTKTQNDSPNYLKPSQWNLPVSQSHHTHMMIFLDVRDKIPKISPQSPQLLAPLAPLITKGENRK